MIKIKKTFEIIQVDGTRSIDVKCMEKSSKEHL